MRKHREKTAVLLVSYLAAAALCLGVLAGTEHTRAETWSRAALNGYERAFGELVTAVGEVDTALQKSLFTTSPSMAGTLCADLFGKALAAQSALAALPFSSDELEQTGGFLSRVGDYAFALCRGTLAGRGLSGEERENLRRLAETSGVLSLNLKELQSGLQDGTLRLTELRRAEGTLDDASEGPAWAGDRLSLIEREFPEVPSLIYDGPFSEHLTGRAPRALEGLEEADENDARKVASELLGVGRSRVWPTGEIGGELPCWGMAADEEGGGTVYVCVTKQGGRVLSLLSSRPVGAAVLTPEQAVERAERFLAAAGYTDMAETYHMTRSGVLTVNFAWRQGEVLCYSDLVKVSVALDSGRICGFEAKGYLVSHCQRELPEIAVDADSARSAVPEDLTVLAVQTALIPSDGQYELLCHEFKCETADGRHCLIYVNAVTGAQEKILLLLEDESGTLTL